MRDLQWWGRLATNPHVGRTIWPSPDVCVFTGARLSGWGVVWQGRVPASGFFDVSEEGAHINELEITVALHALCSFLRFARRKHVQLVSH